MKKVLLDSGFLIRLMNPSEPLHEVALNLFKEYVTSGVTCCVSTIALAEYGVKGDLRFLPVKYLQYLPFLYFCILNQEKLMAGDRYLTSGLIP